MRKLLLAVVAFAPLFGLSQLSGLISVPSTYTSLASAITAINAQGISGSLTVAISAGYSETAPAGGYSLYTTGTSVNQIIFRKNGSGANPIINAYAGGTRTPGSVVQDGIWRLIGTDYITIDGIDLYDGNTGNPQTMEFGYGFFKSSGGDGCQNNTIKNCVITLNKINNATGSLPATDGSRGIEMVNALPGAHTTPVSVTSPAGSHSNNKFYSNIISNCNIGISLIGFLDASPYAFVDSNNEIGGIAAITGNTITNFGGGGTVSAAAAIRTQYQYDLKISFNVINNNMGAGSNHAATLRGIYTNIAAAANSTINNNTITVSGGGTSSQVTAIENQAGASGTNNKTAILNNLISNCNYSTSVSGSFFGITNSASSATLSINGNTFTGNSTAAASGATYLIYNNGNVGSIIDINNNQLGLTYNGPAAYTGVLSALYNSGGSVTGTLTINNNQFSNFSHVNFGGTGTLNFINNTADFMRLTLSGNRWNYLNLNHSGAEYFMNNSSSTQSLLSVSDNTISNVTRGAASGNFYGYYGTASSPGSAIHTFSNNIFSGLNVSASGAGSFYGIYDTEGNVSPYPLKSVYNNTIAGVTLGGTGSGYGMYLSDLGDGGVTGGSTVYNNVVTNLSAADNLYGLYLLSPISPSFAAQVYQNNINTLSSTATSGTACGVYAGSNGAGLNLYKNKIHTVVSTGTAGTSHGLFVGTSGTFNIYNNIFGNISTPASGGANRTNGIFIASGTSVNIFYNTVFLNAVSTGSNFGSNAIYSSSTPTLTMRNNIFINNTVPTGTGVAAAFRRSSTTATTYSASSNNNVFYAGTPGPNNVIFHNGSTGYQTMTAFQTAVSPKDNLSASQNINFLSQGGPSPNYLHVTANIASAAESGANNITGILTDYDSNVRQGNTGYAGTGTAPDVGADEFEQNLTPCSNANAGTISPVSMSICAGQAATLLTSGYTPGTGISHQWRISSSASGPFTNVPSGTGAGTPEYSTVPLSTGIYYYQLQTTCANGSLTAVSNIATIIVNAVPAVSANASSLQLCAGQNFSLNVSPVSGAVYYWSGPGGFSSNAQNPVVQNVPLAASGIYSVTATSGICTSPTSTIAISVTDVSIAVTASPSAICTGESATLSIVTSATSYTWNTGATISNIVVSPTSTAIYSINATSSVNCTAAKTVTVFLITPTITGVGAVSCATNAVSTLAVNAFTPSVVNWYATSSSTTPIGSGASYTINSPVNATVYAQAIAIGAGCASSVIPVSLTVSSTPTLVATANPSIVCPGKPATLTANGASSYTWSSGAGTSTEVVIPTTATLYSVSGTAQGCIGSGTVPVAMHSLSPIIIAQNSTVVCPSQLATFTASGASTYTWSMGPNGPIANMMPAANSSYTVYGTNSVGCISSQTVAVTTKSVPVIAITQSSYLVCPGETVTFSAVGAMNYTWLPGAASGASYAAQPAVHSVYNAIGLGINGCTNVAFASVAVDPCTALKEDLLSTHIVKIYPNPSAGRVTLGFSSDDSKQIELYNLAGELLVALTSAGKTEVLDLSSYAKGLYLVKITGYSYTEIRRLAVE